MVSATDPLRAAKSARSEALRWGLITVALSASLTVMLSVYLALGSMPVRRLHICFPRRLSCISGAGL